MYKRQGDFKVDYTPVFGEPIDLQRFGEIGKKGVLAMRCDSTNVMRTGYTMSEKTVGKTLDVYKRQPYMTVRMMTMTARQYLSSKIKLHRSLRKHYMSSWMMRKNLMLFSRYLSSFWMLKNRRRA